MDHCSLKPNVVEILATGVRQSKSLRHLSLRHNRLSSQKATDAWIATLLDRPVFNDDEIRDMQQRRIWPSRCGLQRLDLTGNYLQAGLATMLGEALSMNHTLTHLVLNDCQIFANECTILADALVCLALYINILQCNWDPDQVVIIATQSQSTNLGFGGQPNHYAL